VVAEYRGLEVGAMTALRRQARAQGVYLRVFKNTLARRALAGTPFELLSDRLVGPLIYGMSADPVAAAKVINDFAKANDKLHQGRCSAQFRARCGCGQGACHHAQPRRAVGETVGHHAGTHRHLRAYAQRSAVQVCSHPGSSSRQGACLSPAAPYFQIDCKQSY